MKNILVVEDEFSIAIDIEQRIQSFGHNVVGVALNFDEAKEILQQHSVDLVVLDINLEDKKSGIDLGHYIQKNNDIPLVYVTAYLDDETFEKAKATGPMAYINKPIKDAELKRAIDLALERFKELEEAKNESIKISHDHIFVKDKGQIHKIKISDIIWLEAMDNYTIIHLEDSKIIASSFLKDVLNSLGSRFIRIHRSHAISFDKVTKIEDNTVYLGTKYLPVSKSYKQELMDNLNFI